MASSISTLRWPRLRSSWSGELASILITSISLGSSLTPQELCSSRETSVYIRILWVFLSPNWREAMFIRLRQTYLLVNLRGTSRLPMKLSLRCLSSFQSSLLRESHIRLSSPSQWPLKILWTAFIPMCSDTSTLSTRASRSPSIRRALTATSVLCSPCQRTRTTWHAMSKWCCPVGNRRLISKTSPCKSLRLMWQISSSNLIVPL